MRSSADSDPSEALSAAADTIVHAARHHTRPVVLIDGRSGAGKTTLARLVGMHLDATVVALDAIYPGWDGLAEGVDRARRGVLEPLSRGESGTWQRWDWHRSVEGGRERVPGDRALVLEGAGILTPATAQLSDVRVWVEAPAELRRQRALRRDGDTYRPHWDRWARQEEQHVRDHEPMSLATFVVTVNGSAREASTHAVTARQSSSARTSPSSR
ncbi:hypothetical protein LJR045_001527 [Microbacterium sp. LjRoot45]|uniref:hypothetical protein n=1 Tax=Microbacterium sp. LjRoot45 TaxID=3342329 RepID=UPI003ED09A5B